MNRRKTAVGASPYELENRKIVARKTLFMTHAAQFGGAELSLLEILSHIDRDVIDPVFASFSDGPLVEEVTNLDIPIHIIPVPADILDAKRKEFGISPAVPFQAAGRFFRSLPVVLKTMDMIESESIEIVYTNSTKAHILGGFAGRRAGVPVLWHFRDYPSSEVVKLFFTGMASTLADAVICNSSFTASQFETHGKVHVARNGLPPEKVKPVRDAEKVRSEFGLGADDILIGTAGRLDKWKGIHTFLSAAADVAKDVPRARFIVAGGAIYGGEEYEKDLKRTAETEGISDKIIFTGFRKDIYDILNAYDIYVHPSEEPEPFGRGIVEAMLLEKPVVAPSAGGPLEIVLENETGMFFKPGDAGALATAIKTLAGDKELAVKLGQNGRRRADSSFSIKRCVDSVTRIIMEQQVFATPV